LEELEVPPKLELDLKELEWEVEELEWEGDNWSDREETSSASSFSRAALLRFSST
jgi:hypothetical protein